MGLEREKLIGIWVHKLKEAREEDEATFNYKKDLMTDELDFDECEQVFAQL